jgi:hypothetical protein
MRKKSSSDCPSSPPKVRCAPLMSKTHRTDADNRARLIRALLMYAAIVFFLVIVLYKYIRIKFFSGMVIALVAGQLALNVLFLPTEINFWEEFSSLIAFYSLIQVYTPFVVLLYSLIRAFTDRRSSGTTHSNNTRNFTRH